MFLHKLNLLDLIARNINYGGHSCFPYPNSLFGLGYSLHTFCRVIPVFSFQKYEVDFLLHAKWNDPRLEHDDKLRHPYLCAMTHLVSILIIFLCVDFHLDQTLSS